MTIKESLVEEIANLKNFNIQDAVLKARILLALAIGKNKEYLVVHDSEELPKKKLEKYREYIHRLELGEPLQYITKEQEFMGLKFFVNKNVLIPRQDTEILVEEVLELIKNKSDVKILDLCTGSGAIAISVARYNPKAKVFASDISRLALDVANENNRKLGTDVEFIESDLFRNIKMQFDIVISNPPYIKEDVLTLLDKEVQKEPKMALNGGEDGLDYYRQIIKEAYKYLKEEGYLCLEIGYDQKEDVCSLIENSSKYEKIYCKKDLSGNDRIVVCQKRK